MSTGGVTRAPVATGTPSPALPVAGAGGSPGAWLRDSWVMTRRNLLHIRREPTQLADVTVQPVIFTVLFVYIFGAAMVLPGGGDVPSFLVPGLLTLNLVTSMAGTAVGLSSDLQSGVIDRFRTLPMATSAVLVGRSASDTLTAGVCATCVLVTGLIVGWSPTNGVLGVLGGVGVALVFSCAVGWGCACLGMRCSSPESAQALAMLVLFPTAFVSNAFAPTQELPRFLEVIAEWNPVSAVTSAVRELFGGPNPFGVSTAWPMQHPVWAALGWSAVVLLVCVPLAVTMYRRRTVT